MRRWIGIATHLHLGNRRLSVNLQEQNRMRERMKEVERQVREMAEQLRVALERVSMLEAKKTLKLPKQ